MKSASGGGVYSQNPLIILDDGSTPTRNMLAQFRPPLKGEVEVYQVYIGNFITASAFYSNNSTCTSGILLPSS